MGYEGVALITEVKCVVYFPAEESLSSYCKQVLRDIYTNFCGQLISRA